MFSNRYLLAIPLHVFLLCGPLAYGSEKPQIEIKDEREQIYVRFLNKWLGPPGSKPINLSKIADAADIKEFESEGDCLNGAILEELQERHNAFSFAGTSIEHRRDIRLIDPKYWQ